MQYLQLKDVLKIHSFIVDETGGMHGVRDRGRIESVIARPAQVTFGKELYPTVFEKASVYAHAIIFDHPFIDGNKRTAMVSAFVFLELNGYASTLENGMIEQYAPKIVREKIDILAISKWLKNNTNSK